MIDQTLDGVEFLRKFDVGYEIINKQEKKQLVMRLYQRNDENIENSLAPAQ